MSKKLFLLVLITASHSLHAVHAVDALNYFLRSTEPKMQIQVAASEKEQAVSQELYKQKVSEHIFVGVCLTACVFVVLGLSGNRS